jgi:hypothetical protein
MGCIQCVTQVLFVLYSMFDLFLVFLCWLGKWAINLRIRQGYLNLMVSAHGCLVGK